MKTHPSFPSLRLLLRAAAPLLALLALVLLAPACTDTDQLPPARQALSFGATLPAMAPATGATTRISPDADATTRAAASTVLTDTKSAFATCDCIAVSIGGVVKPYTYDASTARFTSADPHYRPSPSVQPRADVIAWYPYSPIQPDAAGPDAPAPDQRPLDDFLAAAPLLTAPTALPASGAMPTLTFGHLNALLKLNIKVDRTTLPGLTASHLSSVEIATGPAATPIIAHRGSSAIIAPGCVAAYEALITPQTVSAPGITITTTHTPAKKYTATINPGSPYLAGHVYAYNVTMLKDRIEVSIDESEVEWGQGGIAELKDYDLTVSNAEELKKFAELVNSGAVIPGTKVLANDARVLQTADIDLAGIENWTPIGRDNYFRGAYNGNGYTISKLTINVDALYNGLFGYVEGTDVAAPAVLTGIHLREVKITVNSAEVYCYSGAIAGYTKNAVISFCSAQGEISATAGGSENCTGGITGVSYDNSVINHCRADVKVKARLSSSSGYCSAGGIAGDNFGTILACEASGSSVSAEGEDACAGGITGRNYPTGSIFFCAAQKGEISVAGTKWIYAGGLTGRQLGQLHASYARGKAKAAAVATGSRAGAITGGITDYLNQSYCIGLGEGGQGTSNLDAGHRLADNIAYNTQATDEDIYDLVSKYPKPVTIRTTTYAASRFPAYGIELTEQTFRATGAGPDETAVWELLRTGNGDKIRLRGVPLIPDAP